MTITTSRETIIAAVIAVAARCDGAKDEDGVGFNGQDALFGKRLAALAEVAPEAVTEAMVGEAATMLVKYCDTQVATYLGADVAAEVKGHGLTAARNALARQDARRALQSAQGVLSRRVTVEGDSLVFVAAYDAALVSAFRDLPGRRYDGGTKTNRVPLNRITGSHASFAATWGFQVDDEAEAALHNAPAVDSTPVRTATVVGGDVHLVAPYDAALTEAFRGLPGRRYAGGDLNTAPLNGFVRDFAAAHGFAGLDLIDAALEARSEADKATEAVRDETRALSTAMDAEVIPGVKIKRALFGYQWAGVRYILSRGRVLLGDEMGTGKTTMALAALEASGLLDLGPAVVVVPEITRAAWKREAAQVIPHRSVQVVSGREAQDITADIVVIGYTVLADHVATILAAGPRALVVDESHMVKNPKSNRTQAVAAIAEAIPA